MDISEFELISRIRKSLVTAPVDLVRGIGDDCAVIKRDENSVWLISTDCLVEKIHFDLKYFSFLELGKKAMSVNLSDIAAMGGIPRYAFVTLAIPDSIRSSDIMDFYTGLQQVANEFSTAIVGGDTSSSPKFFYMNLTIIGIAENQKYKLRSTAEVGNSIYVSGPLGASALGLRLIEKKKNSENPFIHAHKNPRPKILLGQILGASPAVTSLIDLSDGLIQDLSHITKSSRVGAQVDFVAIPCDEEFSDMCRSVKLDPVETLLTGGEDYQLLFTVDEAQIACLQKSLNEKRLRIHKIGHIVAREDVEDRVLPTVGRIRVLKNDKPIYIRRGGYDHFLSSV